MQRHTLFGGEGVIGRKGRGGEVYYGFGILRVCAHKIRILVIKSIELSHNCRAIRISNSFLLIFFS